VKSFIAMFELTVPEQRTVVVFLLAFVGIVAAKNYYEKPSAPTAIVQPSPSPGTRP
jgi:hypothetical protein